MDKPVNPSGRRQTAGQASTQPRHTPALQLLRGAVSGFSLPQLRSAFCAAFPPSYSLWAPPTTCLSSISRMGALILPHLLTPSRAPESECVALRTSPSLQVSESPCLPKGPHSSLPCWFSCSLAPSTHLSPSGSSSSTI